MTWASEAPGSAAPDDPLLSRSEIVGPVRQGRRAAGMAWGLTEGETGFAAGCPRRARDRSGPRALVDHLA